MDLPTIYFHISDGCNQNCKHCWYMREGESGLNKAKFLAFESFVNIFEQASTLGLKNVKLTGGEPLIHPEIDKYLDYLKDKNKFLIIETNGIACADNELVNKIALCKPGLIAVSLDGTSAEVHENIRGMKGTFDKTIKGIKNLVNASLKPQLIMSISEDNKHQIEEMVRFAEDLSVASLKFNVVVPIERGKKLADNDKLINIQELIEISDFIENDLARRANIHVIFTQPFAFRPFSRIIEQGQDDGCGIFETLGVLADGKYALCGIGKLMPELVFGDANKDSLADVWNNNEILNDIRQNLPAKLEGVCANCMMKKACLGSCVALNYYRTRNLYAPYWYCEEAFEASLFPESRLVNK
ncbi:MAG: SynChlorMet cassette radical SAM/SPASM protein ScmF [Pseudomonadota bacterium]